MRARTLPDWFLAKCKAEEETGSQFFDVRDFAIPQDHYGTEIGALFPEWRDAIIRAFTKGRCRDDAGLFTLRRLPPPHNGFF